MTVQFDKLTTLDLKMLRTLLVLIETRNVSQAAELLGLQQSTVSYQLGKLRQVLNDPLLVRSGRGFEPSTYAKQIHSGLTAHFNAIERLLFNDHFDKKTATGTLRLACHRNGSRNFIGQLLGEIKYQLPLVRMEIVDWTEQVPSMIKEGKIDFAIGFEGDKLSQLQSIPLVEVGYQIVMSHAHPMAEKVIGKQTVFDYPHAVVSTNEAVERWLDYLADRQNKPRSVEFTSTSMEFTTMALEGTDRLMFAADTNDGFFDNYNVITQPAPFIAEQTVKLLFHERATLDPLTRCMLEIIKTTASKVFA
ncbi:LysR family transcriptional regulator [Vibrio sp. WXL210]|uniref:LysR family transcriptional regulator n=1 Tax=Vibrio sp. WXL210 TaxID=3450709 RepID=UPI003EC916F9